MTWRVPSKAFCRHRVCFNHGDGPRGQRIRRTASRRLHFLRPRRGELHLSARFPDRIHRHGCLSKLADPPGDRGLQDLPAD